MIKSKKQQKRFNHKRLLKAAVCAMVLAGSLGWSADASALFVQNDSSKNNIGVTDGYVYGTKREDGSLQNNNLLVTGKKPSSGTYATYNQTRYAGAYGYASYTYSEDEGLKLHDVYINNNTLTLSNISTPSISKVYGGYVAISGDLLPATPTASGNTLIIDNVNFDAREGVYGGYAYFGNTDNNTVLIKGGTVACPVYGAYSYGSPVLYGIQGQAYNNKVIIDGATVNLSVYGADVWGINAPSGGNSVVINAGTVNGYVYGAYSASRLNAVHNTVTVNQNSTVNDTIYGGYGLGSGNENTVNITDSVLGTVYGGYGKTDDGNNNVVNIDWDSQGPVGQNSVVKGSVYGGYGVDDALSNNVNVAGLVKGSVYGGYGVENALSNNVNVAGLVEGSVYGGYGKNLRGNDNILNITSQVKGSVYGGYGPINANNNTVTINNGDIQATVYGGYVEGNVSTGNVVNIVGSSIAKDVYAGYAVSGAPKNNTVNLIGKGAQYTLNGTTMTAGEMTIGGKVYGSNNGVNGTLNVSGTKIGVGNVANFSTMNFTLGNEVGNRATMLYVTGEEKKTDLSQTDVTVYIKSDSPLKTGDYVNLIQPTNLSAIITQPKSITVTKGALLTADASAGLNKLGNSLVLGLGIDPAIIVGGIIPKPSDAVDPWSANNDKAKSMAETVAAGVALVNSGMDFFANTGMKEALNAVEVNKAENNSGLAPFAAVGGSKFRYQTGSYVDINSWNTNVGVAKEFGSWTVGIAGEYNKGSYDTYMDGGLRPSGKTRNTGVAIFAKKDLDNGWHGDVQLRVGRNKSDYKAFNGANSMKYDNSANYYSTGLTLGKKLELNDKEAVDVYGRYAWTHLRGSDVTTHIDNAIESYDSRLSFDAVDSHRMTLGARWNRQMDKANQLYAGMAWQYEFSGDANSTVYDNAGHGYKAPAPSLKGHSGILELGWKAKAGKNLSVDVNASGWTGKQKGVAGSVGLEWKF